MELKNVFISDNICRETEVAMKSSVIKRRKSLFLGVLFLIISTTAAYGRSLLNVNVKADPRVELMSLIFRLADKPEYSKGRVVSYNKDIDAHFAAYKDHPVVQMARKLWKTHGVSFDAVMSLAIHIQDADELQETVPFVPRPKNLDKRWKIIEAREFLDAARRFVKETDFKHFSQQHQQLYNTTVSRLNKVLKEQAQMDWFDTFFGRRPGARFIIVPGLLNGGHCYGVKVRLSDGSEELYSIPGVWLIDQKGLPFFDSSVLSMVVHEFCHSYINSLVDKHESFFKKPGKTIYPYVAAAMKRQNYPDWKIMIYESLVRACVVRYMRAVNGAEAAKKQMLQEIENKFPWIERLSDLLGKYETQRKEYPTFESFLPEIAAFFEKYAADLEKAPKVVAVIPANGAADVDPNLQFIIINFDRPMRDLSWSVVGGGEHFPQITGKPFYHSERMILSVPVKLKPAWQYEFWLNSERYLGFKSAEGVPLVPVRVWFKTRSK